MMASIRLAAVSVPVFDRSLLGAFSVENPFNKSIGSLRLCAPWKAGEDLLDVFRCVSISDFDGGLDDSSSCWFNNSRRICSSMLISLFGSDSIPLCPC